MKLKQSMYLVHRWLGIIMCLLLAMWFFSGVVMMYVHFPHLHVHERLAALPALSADKLRYSPEQLLQQANPALSVQELKLTSIQGRPAYLLRTGDQQRYGMFADNGDYFSSTFNADDALLAAQVFAVNSGLSDGSNISYQALIEIDQWSLSSIIRPHRPLHLLTLNDAAATQLYISSLTGEVVRDTTRRERIWNWLGANLHWIYPLQLRQHGTVWHWVIVVLSLLGMVSIITGAVVGLWRLRLRKRYRGKNVTPYQGNMKLHHIMGLLFLIPLTTFMFSGLMSMNPFGVFTEKNGFGGQLAQYRGNTTVAQWLEQPADLQALHNMLNAHPDSREILWYWINGKAHYYAVSHDLQRYPARPQAASVLQENALASLQQIMAGHSINTVELLTRYDSYYYSHHQRWRPLPVLRVRFDDPAHSWFYVDLTTGELINRHTRTSRVQRWLYNGLHSLDFTFLIHHRPLWDVVVIILSIAGFVFSVSSVVISWHRLRIKVRKTAKRSRKKTGVKHA